jgi:hypothetical protein
MEILDHCLSSPERKSNSVEINRVEDHRSFSLTPFAIWAVNSSIRSYLIDEWLTIELGSNFRWNCQLEMIHYRRQYIDNHGAKEPGLGR